MRRDDPHQPNTPHKSALVQCRNDGHLISDQKLFEPHCVETALHGMLDRIAVSVVVVLLVDFEKY